MHPHTKQLLAELAFNDALYVGQIVQVRWTNIGRYNVAKAVIEKLNTKTVLAKLLHAVPGEFGGWTLGETIKVPRIMTNGHSINNGVYPAQAYRVFDRKSIYEEKFLEAFSPIEAIELALPLMLGCPIDQVIPKVVETVRADLRVGTPVAA